VRYERPGGTWLYPIGISVIDLSAIPNFAHVLNPARFSFLMLKIRSANLLENIKGIRPIVLCQYPPATGGRYELANTDPQNDEKQYIDRC
jgi:hypothetical protein